MLNIPPLPPPPENRVVYEIRWKHTEYTVAFPLQRWLRERDTLLRYSYTVVYIH